MAVDAETILREAIEFTAIPTIMTLGPHNNGAKEAVLALRAALVKAKGREDAWGRPLCAECGRAGYPNRAVGPVRGHLDGRIKHPFIPTTPTA